MSYRKRSFVDDELGRAILNIEVGSYTSRPNPRESDLLQTSDVLLRDANFRKRQQLADGRCVNIFGDSSSGIDGYRRDEHITAAKKRWESCDVCLEVIHRLRYCSFSDSCDVIDLLAVAVNHRAQWRTCTCRLKPSRLSSPPRV